MQSPTCPKSARDISNWRGNIGNRFELASRWNYGRSISNGTPITRPFPGHRGKNSSTIRRNNAFGSWKPENFGNHLQTTSANVRSRRRDSRARARGNLVGTGWMWGLGDRCLAKLDTHSHGSQAVTALREREPRGPQSTERLDAAEGDSMDRWEGRAYSLPREREREQRKAVDSSTPAGLDVTTESCAACTCVPVALSEILRMIIRDLMGRMCLIRMRARWRFISSRMKTWTFWILVRRLMSFWTNCDRKKVKFQIFRDIFCHGYAGKKDMGLSLPPPPGTLRTFNKIPDKLLEMCFGLLLGDFCNTFVYQLFQLADFVLNWK